MVTESISLASAESSVCAAHLATLGPVPAGCQSARLLQRMMAGLPGGLLMLTTTGTVELSNARLWQLFGLSADEPGRWQGQPASRLYEQLQGLLRPESAPVLLRWLIAPGPQGAVAQLQLRGGTVLAGEQVAVPGGWLLTLRDVTREQQHLSELEAVAAMTECSPHPIVRLGPGRRQFYANAAARKLTQGLSRREHARIQHQLRTCTAPLDATDEVDLEVSLKQKVFKVVRVSRTEQDVVNLYFSDITEREAARRQLAEQQQFTEQVLDAIPCAVFVVDPNHEVIFQNRAMQELIQSSPFGEGQQTKTPEQTEREVTDYREMNELVRRTGQDVIREEPFTLADGVTHWYYAVKRPLRRPDGEVHILQVSLDITALKQAQQTLQRSEKQYRDLMHYTQALICTYDMQGNVLAVNPALAQLLGQPGEALVGQPVTRHLPFDDRAAFTGWMSQLTGAGATKGVLRLQLADSDEMRHLLYHNVAVVEPDEEPYVISHAHDITDRIQAEREMQNARLAAEKAVRARENFLANMSHEIRTPMNGVLGVANLLARTSLTPQQQEYLSTIRASGQHLLAVLNDVLDMAKITSGKLELNDSPFNVCDSVGQALQPLLLQAQDKGITCVTRPLHESCPLPWVRGDAHRINQIMINLVSNAIKFTPRGGTITVEGSLVTETATELTLQFSVADTGIGMRPEVLSRIFESFTQAYSDTARRFGGTGLGLSISRALVERMGGELTVESTENEGSIFGFTLVLPKAEVPTALPEPVEFDTGVLQGVRVLLVEDNDINRYVARATMQEWGVVVAEANNGAIALELFEQHEYDVVLMDIQMPGMSGLEATACIRQHAMAARAGIPILALTANAFRADHEQYLASGMDACLAKPFEEAELYACLRSLLRR